MLRALHGNEQLRERCEGLWLQGALNGGREHYASQNPRATTSASTTIGIT